MEVPTMAVIGFLLTATLVFVLMLSRLNRIGERRLRNLQTEYRVSRLKGKVEILSRVRQGYAAAERWLEARRSEQARAARLSKIPREVRLIFEDLEEALNLVEASTDIDVRSDVELRRAFVKGLIRAGALALELDNPTSAIRRMRRVLEEGEKFIIDSGEDLGHVYFVLGTAYMVWGAQEKSRDELFLATEYLEKAATTSNEQRVAALSLHNLAWAHDELGRIEKDRERFRMAVEVLRRSLEIEPNNPTARYNLACDLAILDEYEQALDELRRISPDSDVWELAPNDEDFVMLKGDPQRKEEFEKILALKLRGSAVAGSLS